MSSLDEHDGLIINNTEFDQTCHYCGYEIKSKSIHQKLDGLGLCVPTVIHYHRWYKNTGNCFVSGCKSKIPLGEIEYETRQACLVRPWDLKFRDEFYVKNTPID